MNKFWNFGEPDGPNELRLDGEIASESWWGDEVTPAIFRAELMEHPGDITVWINSPGGDVFAASSIYTALKEHAGRVTVKIEALAASAASIVAMAGDEILIAPTAYMMIHRAATIALGDSDEMRAAARTLDEVDGGIVNLYAMRTGQSADKIERMMKATTWMNAASAVELGFADGMLYSEDAKAQPEQEGATTESGGTQTGPMSSIGPRKTASARAAAVTFAASSTADALIARLKETGRKPDPKNDQTHDDNARERFALRMKLMQKMGGMK